MVEYFQYDGKEFVRLNPGMPSVDDPVGGYLFTRLNKGSSGKVRINGRKLSYEQALLVLEKGEMLKNEYNSLLRKANPKSFSQRRDELNAAPILNSRTVKVLFGDLEKLTESEREAITSAASSKKLFGEFLFRYLSEKVNNIPEGFGNYRERLLDAAKKCNLEAIDFTLVQLTNSIGGTIDFQYGNSLKYDPRNRELKEEYYQINNTGLPLELARFFKELPRRIKR